MPPTFPYSDTTSVDTDFGLGGHGKRQMPSVWDIHDEVYEFAPEKPQGDPWKTILDPLMEKDQVQCSSWKEEVQNLLIFAGLFSAVVTAFIIEAYKLLQPPSPPDLSTSLLFIRMLSDHLNVTAASVPAAPFSPTPSSIRINIFWFLSLMLSLATVLIGIISLQWLREYQSYPSLTPRETLALFNMRSEAFERWHVKRIFSSLPLLLQAALVLFFGGIVDFLGQLRKEVAIPVTVVISITLLFLVSTTVLPAFQSSMLYVWPLFFKNSSKPSQCPYKSPQSWTFHAVYHSLGALLSMLKRVLSRLICLAGSVPSLPSAVNLESDHITPYLSAAVEKQNWVDFDLAWLSIRDSYVHGSLDRDSGLLKSRSTLNPILPLYDLSQVLRNAIVRDAKVSQQSESQLSVVYYCFQDILLSFLDSRAFIHASHSDDLFNDVQRCYKYLSALFKLKDPGYRLSIQYDRPRYRNIITGISASAARTLYNLHLHEFLVESGIYFVSKDLSKHVLEIKMRIMKSFFGPRHDYYIRPIALPYSLPTSLRFYTYEMRQLRNKKKFAEFYWQYCNLLADYFKFIAYAGPQDFWSGRLHGHRDVLDFLESAGQHAYSACSSDTIIHITSQNRRELSHSFGGILDFIASELRRELSMVGATVRGRIPRTGRTTAEPVQIPERGPTSSRSQDPSSIDLFYASAIFIKRFLSIQQEKQRPSSIDFHVTSLLIAIATYKTVFSRRRDNIPNKRLEEQFESEPWEKGVPRFSDEWWSFLDNIPQTPGNLTTSSSRPPSSSRVLGLEVESQSPVDDRVSDHTAGMADISNSVSSIDMGSEYTETSHANPALSRHHSSASDIPPIIVSSPQVSPAPTLPVRAESEAGSDDNSTVNLRTHSLPTFEGLQSLQPTNTNSLAEHRAVGHLNIPRTRHSSLPRTPRTRRSTSLTNEHRE